MNFLRIVTLGLFACTANAAQAQDQIAEQDGLGIKLEELLSEKGKFRLELGGTFSASRQSGVSGLYQTIQTGTGDFVTVPVDVGSTNRQADTALATVGLRYGLTVKSEIYTRATLRYDNSRFTDSATGETQSLSDSSLQNLILGVNYRFLDEGDTPGLIGFADISVVQNTAARGTDLQFAKAGTVGLTAYRVLDPVVLSLTAGYRINRAREVGSETIDPSDSLFINPSIAFAVNNELTLTGGFGLDFSGDDRVNGVDQDNRRTNADLQFGLAYAWDKNTTLRADTRTEVLGDSNVTLGITLTRKLGQD